ncbi:MAG: GNAT family N-acetyltransferase [Anaerolineae bacterium]
MHPELVPFDNAMLPDAGRLLALRHAHDRAALPTLPSRFEEAAVAAKAVRAALDRPMAQGFAAVRGDRVVGYCIGDVALAEIWGRSGWVRPPGCAVGPDEDAELVRDLYAALGQRWIDLGCFSHYAVVPTSDPALLQMWYSLSFGIQQVYGLRALDDLGGPGLPLPPGVEIRVAGPDDRTVLADFSDIIWRHQVQAPVWGMMLPETVEDQREGWAELVDEPGWTVWLAFYEGQPVGIQGYHPEEESDEALIVPEACASLSVAGTREGARGRGVGQAMTRRGLKGVRDAGFRVCLTDWRSTNLLSSRFWPRQGFAPVAYRLNRIIDSRIAWARGND